MVISQDHENFLHIVYMPSITLTILNNTNQKQKKLKTALKVSKQGGINNVKIPQNLQN
jgi:hypothetical protein